MLFIIAVGSAIFAFVAALRLHVSYRRVILAVRSMDDTARATLPPEVYSSLSEFSSLVPSWVYSWQSRLFEHITTGDISWARDFPFWSHVQETRARFYAFVWALVMCVVVFFFILITELPRPAE